MAPSPLLLLCLFLAVWGINSIPVYSPYVPAAPGSRPACARETVTFCESVDKYPKELIQSLLRSEFSNVFDLFNDESEGLEEPPFLHQEMPVAAHSKRRRARSPDTPANNRTVEECPVVARIVSPEVALNVDGEWRFVAPHVAGSGQEVRVELCDFQETDKCRDLCSQMQDAIPLRSLDSDGSLKEDLFWMPTSCSCLSPSTEQR